MKAFIVIILFNLLLFAGQGQLTIDIPEFKNINPKDKYPEHSVLSTYTNNFDILISLNCYSAWGPDHSVKILAQHRSGWYKIEINTDPLYINNSVCYSTYKINDTIGRIVWDSLIQNQLFEMNDGREIQATCITTDTIRYRNGKLRIVEVFQGNSSDGPEYEFEIFTKTNYKKLYFYSPQDLVDRCPPPERRWILSCITVFEKHLGK